jgi:large subunit ribosomal protein L11
MSKQVAGYVKLQLPAQKAAPSQKIGAALGKRGLNIMEFCKTFNKLTEQFEMNAPVRIIIEAYVDKTFIVRILGAPTAYFIKQAIGIDKGSTAPGRISAGTITWNQISNIAQKQVAAQSVTARSLLQAENIIAGVVKSMGIKITGERKQVEEQNGGQNG